MAGLLDSLSSMFGFDPDEEERRKRRAQIDETIKRHSLANRRTLGATVLSNVEAKQRERQRQQVDTLVQRYADPEHSDIVGRAKHFAEKKKREAERAEVDRLILEKGTAPELANARDEQSIQGFRQRLQTEKNQGPAVGALGKDLRVNPRDYPNLASQNDPRLFIGRTPEELATLEAQFKQAQEQDDAFKQESVTSAIDQRVADLLAERAGQLPEGTADKRFREVVDPLQDIQRSEQTPEQAEALERATHLRNLADRLRVEDPRAHGYDFTSKEEVGKEVQKLEEEAAGLLEATGQDTERYDPIGTFVKAAPGKVMEILATIGESGGGPRLVGDALYGPGGGDKAVAELEKLPPDLLDRFGKAVAISPGEERQNPVAKFIGGMVGMAAVMGPASSGLGSVPAAGNTVFQRGLAAVLENQPELAVRLILGIESGTLTPEQALKQAAVENAMAFGAGAGFAGAMKALSKGLDDAGLNGKSILGLEDTTSDAGKIRAQQQRAREFATQEREKGAFQGDRIAALIEEDEIRQKVDADQAEVDRIVAESEADAQARVAEELLPETPAEKAFFTERTGQPIQTDLDQQAAKLFETVETGKNAPPEVRSQVENLPPVPEGHTRVFRWEGEGAKKAGAAGAVEGGVWFEENPWAYYGKGAKGKFQDIPTAEWNQYKQQLSGNTLGTEAVLPAGVAKQALDLDALEFDPKKSENFISGSGRSGVEDLVDEIDSARQAGIEIGEGTSDVARLIKEGGAGSDRVPPTRAPEPGKPATRTSVQPREIPLEAEEAAHYKFSENLEDDFDAPVAGGGMISVPVRKGSGELRYKYAGNINLERIAAPTEALQEVLDARQIYGLDIELAAGPRKTFAQYEEGARAILNSRSKTKALLLKRRGAPYTPEEAFALREMHARSAVKLSEAVKRRRGTQFGTPEWDAASRNVAQGIHNLLRLQKQASAAARVSGQTLGQFRKMASGKIVEGLDIDAIARHIDSFDDITQIIHYTKQLNPTTLDKLHEVWINSLVSASDPVNITSNLIKYLYTGPVRAVEGGIDFVTSLGGTRRGRQVYAREAIEFLKFHQTRKALQHAWEHWKTGEAQGPARISSKFEHREALSGGFGNFMRKLGTRRLAAEDEAFAHVSYASELHAQALRQGLKEGKHGRALDRRIRELLSKPLTDPDEPFHFMHEAALKTAEENTFVDRTHLGDAGSRLKSVPLFRWLLPFTRVGSSITTFAVESSPAGFITGAGRMLGGQSAAKAFAKPIAGTALLGGTAYFLRKNGLITGSRRPTQAERETLWANGWQENSIYIPPLDRWVRYDRLEPFGMIIGNAVDAIDAWERGDLETAEKLALVTQNALKRFKDGTWVRGLNDAFDSMEGDFGKDIERWFAHFATGFVPKIATRPLQQATGASEVRPTTFKQEVMKQLGFKGDSRKKYDVYGLPADAEKTLLDKAMATLGYHTKGPRRDPVLNERIRLGKTIQRVDFPKSNDPKTGLNEKDMFSAATPQEIADFVLVKGQFLHMIDSSVMDSRAYKRADDDARATILERARSFGSQQFHKAWREEGRPLNARQLNQATKKIPIRTLIRRITNLRDVKNLSPAELDKLQSELEALEIIDGSQR